MSKTLAKILVIEDNLADILLLKKAFAQSGVTVEIFSARGGDQGLRILDEEFGLPGSPELDLILLDINMPGLGGLQVLEKIRERDYCKTIPVIMLTASRLEPDVLDSVDKGATSFVNKASNLAELYQIVRNISECWLPSSCRISGVLHSGAA